MKFTDPQFLIPALSVTFVCDVASSAHCLNVDSARGYYYVSIIVLATEGKIDRSSYEAGRSGQLPTRSVVNERRVECGLSNCSPAALSLCRFVQGSLYIKLENTHVVAAICTLETRLRI